MSLHDDIELLEDYAELDGSEWGEMIQALLGCYQMRAYMSDDFVAAVEREIESNALNARENCRVEQHSETQTFTVRELLWD